MARRVHQAVRLAVVLLDPVVPRAVVPRAVAPPVEVRVVRPVVCQAQHGARHEHCIIEPGEEDIACTYFTSPVFLHVDHLRHHL